MQPKNFPPRSESEVGKSVESYVCIIGNGGKRGVIGYMHICGTSCCQKGQKLVKVEDTTGLCDNGGCE